MYSDKITVIFSHSSFICLFNDGYLYLGPSSASRGHCGVTTDQSYEGPRAPPVRHGNTQLCVNRSGKTGYQR